MLPLFEHLHELQYPSSMKREFVMQRSSATKPDDGLVCMMYNRAGTGRFSRDVCTYKTLGLVSKTIVNFTQ